VSWLGLQLPVQTLDVAAAAAAAAVAAAAVAAAAAAAVAPPDLDKDPAEEGGNVPWCGRDGG
jgi:Spy/CpxP family protein refolding chaperone